MRALIRETFYLRSFGLLKIPMIFFLRPTVLELSRERAVIRVPLSYRSKNHLGSMYFGALCIGADCSGGVLVTTFLRERGADVSFIFKDVSARFMKRAEGDVHFACYDGRAVEKLVDEALRSGERVNTPLTVVATVPQKGTEPVAEFTLTLSLKRR
jgi:hypothetical protein